MRRPQRYGWAAPLYDLVSMEWPVYRAGRVAGVEALGLQPGGRVMDLGCGTGLTLPLLQGAVGPTGRIVGVDASSAMLRQARRRVSSQDWHNVDLLRADATTPGSIVVAAAGRLPAVPGLDAVIVVYALSLMTPWRAAWQQALTLVRPGARVVVVDMAEAARAPAVLRPLARLACAFGGADIHAHPWQALDDELEDVTQLSLRGGHIRVHAGTVPSSHP